MNIQEMDLKIAKHRNLASTASLRYWGNDALHKSKIDLENNMADQLEELKKSYIRQMQALNIPALSESVKEK